MMACASRRDIQSRQTQLAQAIIQKEQASPVLFVSPSLRQQHKAKSEANISACLASVL
jgi:hypothetical protein